MSQNNSIHPILYAGLDIHKATLQLHLQGRDSTWPNTTAGHRELLALLVAHPGVQVVCEASGGYERQVVAAVQAAGIPVSVLNPAQVRSFARALGQRAKTDPLDARLLAQCGLALHPAPTPVRAQPERELTEIMRYRHQLLDKLVAERQQSEMIESVALRRQSAALVRRLEADLKKLETLLSKLRRESQAIETKAQRLMEVPGVGALTALALLAEMPELGRLNRRQAAALAGLAPHPRQSGAWIGKASIGGGRAPIRRALYMAAVCAARIHPTFKPFYQRLRAAGKPFKVAITALMRKLLLLLNLALKNPQLPLAS